MVRLISREVIFAEFQVYMITCDTSTLQRDKQTDGQTTCLGNTALRIASRGKNTHGVCCGGRRKQASGIVLTDVSFRASSCIT